jgi:hypothetical protein
MKKASPELESFIDESIKRSRAKGYQPTTFEGMRRRWGTHEAIRRLVISGEIQSGFRKMIPLGLRDWTVESAVVRFSDEFGKEETQAAQWRLDQASRS